MNRKTTFEEDLRERSRVVSVSKYHEEERLKALKHGLKSKAAQGEATTTTAKHFDIAPRTVQRILLKALNGRREVTEIINSARRSRIDEAFTDRRTQLRQLDEHFGRLRKWVPQDELSPSQDLLKLSVEELHKLARTALARASASSEVLQKRVTVLKRSNAAIGVAVRNAGTHNGRR